MLELIFVMGPTASGKSAYAFNKALELTQVEKKKAAILCCDSIQLYQDLKIGSAGPSELELQKVNHFLYHYLPLLSRGTAGGFRRDALEVLYRLEKENYELAFLVGGTGFYFQALERGLPDIKPNSEAIQQQLSEEIKEPGGRERLYQELINFDPSIKDKIHIQDTYRIQRALDLKRSQGIRFSEIPETYEKLPWKITKWGFNPDKDELLKKIKVRTKKLIRSGIVDETQNILNRLNGKPWPPLLSVGYAQVVDYLNPEVNTINSLSQLEEAINLATAQLAKKQRTWFKRDRETLWLSSPTVDDPG